LTTSWQIYRGTGQPHDGIARLPDPPGWRRFTGEPDLAVPDYPDEDSVRRLGDESVARKPTPDEIRIVNAALYLRRPLLVTGKPGTGKSTLAYSVARELKLGPVLKWSITSRTTLQQGLYHYDAVGRLHDENVRNLRANADNRASMAETDIGRYIRLGPLGTALLPYSRPRVVLIDEIDKSDIDLPNDLLNVFEEGEFTIDELARLPEDQADVKVMTADEDLRRVPVHRGRVRCHLFPFIVMSSNDEREFPPAFLRRCLTVRLQPPTAEQLSAMIAAHLGVERADEARSLVDQFLRRRTEGDLAADQLLNVIFLTALHGMEPELEWREVVNALLHSLRAADVI
jgi:MoxR-like ATPase